MKEKEDHVVGQGVLIVEKEKKMLLKNAAVQMEKEYQIFINYLEQNKVKISNSTGNIGKKDCCALNQQLVLVRERYLLNGRTQEYYAVIDFFCFFSVRTGILQIKKKRGLGLTLEKTQRYAFFSKMSNMERYLLMMTVWFVEYQEAIDYSYSMFKGNGLFDMFKGEEGGRALTNPFHDKRTAPWGYHYFQEIRLFALFHLITIEWRDEQEGNIENKFCIKALYQTQEGCYLKKVLEKHIRYFWDILDLKTALDIIGEIVGEESKQVREKIAAFLKPKIEIGSQTIEFSVKVGSCERIISIGDQFTLDDLHYQIQESVDFDKDHLYYFQFGKGTLKKRYFAPECDDEMYQASNVTLAELMLCEGMQFEYLFDFGDQWIFRISVKQIITEHTKESKISHVKGENPTQYRYFDEEW